MAELPNRLQVGTTFEQAIPIINNALDEIDNENRTKIISNQQVPNLLLGYQKGGFLPSGDYGLKISKINPGTGLPYDVTTATEDQLAFDSAFDQLRVVKTGTVNMALLAPGNSETVSVAHGLDFAPAFLAYAFLDPGGGEPLQYFPVPTVTLSADPVTYVTSLAWEIDVNTDTTNINFTYITGFGGIGSFTIRYYILQETVA